MGTLAFQALRFLPQKEKIKVLFHRQFYFFLEKKDLQNIASFKIKKDSITFDCPLKRAQNKFNLLLARGLQNLKNITTRNPAVYIHQNSGTPLIGSIYFGLVYRNTNVIELKPQTSCNLDCIYCSVSEGLSSQQTDYIVEKDYLIKEFIKLANFVDEPLEAHIGCQGEPLLYQDLLSLIKDLSQLKQVRIISMDTNGTLITKDFIDHLAKIHQKKPIRINFSLNAMDQEVAQKMAHSKNYNLKHILKIIKYASKKIDILIAPLFLPGINHQELPKLIEFAQSLDIKNNPSIAIQNFLNYKTGRNPAHSLDWQQFHEKLKPLEEKYNLPLFLKSSHHFGIKPSKKLPKPFQKDDTIQARIVAPGRYPGSRLAVHKNRNITIFNCPEETNKGIRVKIIRDKHNIFLANRA